ncbi:MAG: NERD domain-containing protein, partial [Methanobacteriota archaeon]
MRYLAIIIPEKIPSTISKGIQRIFSGLRNLPDDYLIYYEPLINPQRPDFIIISPNLGLLVIEIRNWYPGHISAISEDEIRIEDDNPRREIHPFVQIRQFLDSIIQRSAK